MRCEIGDSAPDVIVERVDVPLAVGLNLEFEAWYAKARILRFVADPPQVLTFVYPHCVLCGLPVFNRWVRLDL